MHLEESLLAHKSASSVSSDKFWAMIYLIPVYHNPTGRCLSSGACQRILELAKRLDILVVCDDVYNLLHYEDSPPPTRLLHRSQSTGATVISNGSFSKILAPGMRMGWIESDPVTLSRLANCGVLNSGGAANHVMSGVISHALQSGQLTKHLLGLKTEYVSTYCCQH